MDLKSVVKQLRHAADAIDSLLQGEGTPAIARKILDRPKRKYTKKTDGRTGPRTPEQRLALSRRMRKVWRDRRAKAAA
jgi:hypothetical protein